MDRNPNMAKILELKLKWVARDRQNRHTVNGKDYVHNFKLLTMAAVICRRFTKNFLYQCDLKWELPFSPYTQKIFRFKCVFSVVVTAFSLP
jgi:hypothetical protein